MLEPHSERVTWDAVIHSVADIEALRWPPRTVNVKPSRFGSVERLFAAYDYCEANGIGAYGGGQFELGVGRDQIQLLAALFHPGTPNDVAPGGFNLGAGAGPARQPARRHAPLDRLRHRRLSALAIERREQVVDGHERQRLDPRASACSQHERQPRDRHVVGSLDDVDEVVLAERDPLVEDPRPSSSRSRLTSRRRPGFELRVWMPFSVNVVSIR